MAATPTKSFQSPSKPYLRSQSNAKSTPAVTPVTPQSLPIRRSTRSKSLHFDSPNLPMNLAQINSKLRKAGEPGRISINLGLVDPLITLRILAKIKSSPAQVQLEEMEMLLLKHQRREMRRGKSENRLKSVELPKRHTYYKKVVYDGGEFEVGDAVYVKRREDATSDDEDPEVEECRLCFCSGNEIMIECDECLGGFHLKCLKPPLKDVPEGDWICGFCEARKMGREVNFPKPPHGKKLVRTMRQKLLSSDLGLLILREVDGNYWCRVRWYIIPEETSAGRQPHNLSRELYQTNDFANIEMESVLRHCYVMTPKNMLKQKMREMIYSSVNMNMTSTGTVSNVLLILTMKERMVERLTVMKTGMLTRNQTLTLMKMLNMKRKILKMHNLNPQQAIKSAQGAVLWTSEDRHKRIPQHIRSHKQTDLERAKATLLLASLPKSLPCRNKEMEEITTFIKGAISDDQCLGRCLYIHGVPGTGKTMSVLSVMRSLRSEVDAGNIKPYCFVEINGLKLASPENIYKVIYEALNGHRVSWKKALHLLNERFVEGKKTGEEADRPCILLIDELDLLVTRNQSVLYNILDWPTKPHSKLIVIGIANTMDLPEKLLPRISSRMGIQRLCFSPYNYQQLQEIISSRLKGNDVFEKQAIEFASRKVAAISGDARRALEICRRAAEIADYRMKEITSNTDIDAAGKGLVVMADVEAAIQEMFQAPHIQLAMTVSALCTSNGEVFPGYDTLLQVGCKLGECRVILCEAGAKHRLQKLQLNFPRLVLKAHISFSIASIEINDGIMTE
ncbi:Zinc finger, PHD-type [Sesbania bispinosa]|nr:Zinc finger, PHD-type [Sesbania bispinosa]